MCTVVLWVCAVVSVMLPVMLRVNLVVPFTEAVQLTKAVLLRTAFCSIF